MRSLSETGEVEVANKTKDEIFMEEAIQLARRERSFADAVAEMAHALTG